MEKNLGGTSFDSNTPSNDADVDALIAGALKDLVHKPSEGKGLEEKVLKATPMEKEPVKKPAAPPETAKPEEKKPTETQQAYEKTFKDLKTGAIVSGIIVKVDQAGVLVDIGYKSEGFLPIDEIPEEAKIGDRIAVMIEKLENKEGYVELSKKNADFELKWQEAYDAYKNRTAVDAKVTSAVRGGLVVDWQGIRGFIPASQVLQTPEEPLESFVGKTVPVKVIEVNHRQSKIVFSHKLGAVEQDKKEVNKLFDELEVGQVRHGIVKSLKSFGAFVDLGGVEGLVHLSELSWKRVKHPSELLKSGQELDVFVLGIDKANRKVSLGLKELQPDPWATATQKFRTGQTVKVKVLRLAKFGAFAELEEGLEGLIHLSELSKDRIETPDQAVKPGDIVEAKILRILPDEQKIGLSIREIQLAKERTEAEEKKKEESKITIGAVIAEKERLKAEKEAEMSQEEPQ